MAYDFDVFISYRRHGEWPTWTREIFRPLLYHWLGEELGRDPRIFVDYQIETGDSWPERLGNALGCSRVLVPLFSRQYFSSPWCRSEFALMRAREARCNFRSPACPGGLIVPAHIHDGKDFPESVRSIQGAQLQPYTNVRLSRGSITEERLSDEIRNWVPDIAGATNRAPDHDPAWLTIAAQEFLEQFLLSAPKQLVPPSLG
jgi:TIR domain